MVVMDLVYILPTRGLIVQANQLSPTVGSSLCAVVHSPCELDELL